MRGEQPFRCSKAKREKEFKNRFFFPYNKRGDKGLHKGCDSALISY